MNEANKTLYSASIRVVKSIAEINHAFDTTEIEHEPLIEAVDKDEVKRFLIEKYPQFFPTIKVYEKETKDTAQFFYVVIKKLNNWQLEQHNSGNWTCNNCNEIHDSKYISRPRYTNKPPFVGLLFCDNGNCIDEYKVKYYKYFELPDDDNYVNSGSPNYIYKCTEKSTGKCYVGKTRNAPFFRWWNHLTHSSSPFGLYLRTTKLSDWSFEVLDILPPSTSDSDVFKLESEYMIKFDSINNGFNSLISNKKAA